ncbi:hypothetical protein J3F84DRAFT_254958 [Trichoderma pleuroticola]
MARSKRITSLLSTSSTTAWEQIAPKLPQHSNMFPPGLLRRLGTEPDIENDDTYKAGPKEKKRGEREGGKASRKRRRHVRHFASFFSSSLKQTLRGKKTRCLCLISRLASFPLLYRAGNDEIEDEKQRSELRKGANESGRIKIDKVSFFFLFSFSLQGLLRWPPCLDGPDRPSQKTNSPFSSSQFVFLSCHVIPNVLSISDMLIHDTVPFSGPHSR